ncbi:MAG: glycosyltransferase [Deltaproteobacteria bacterium]|nr:glycosyltransferase [Deltaproteobacteria bacterium]
MDGSKFSTSLREDARKKIEHLRETDIVIGIPSYFSGSAIEHVLQTVITGLRLYFNKHKALIVVFDGGSTDDTRECARSVSADGYNIEVIVSIYRGIPGKGSSLRAVFEVARFLKAKAVAVFDSDLKSIAPEWVKNVLDPIFEGYDFVAPDYYRYKFDGTITNTIAYNLTRALYGINIRQPIGGDFGVSSYLVRHYLDQDVWETDVAKFGIDIWMTTTAIINKFRVCQARLGAKIHGEKDPGGDLSPMFRQVVGTIFTMMESHHDYWAAVSGSVDVPNFGEYCDTKIQEFDIDQDALIDYFKIGLENFGGVWERLFAPQDMAVIEQLAAQPDRELFHLPIKNWVRIVYRYAQAFHATPRQKFKVMDTMIPLYNARVASLINELKDKSMEDAEAYFNQQALVFVNMKPYLLEIWT